MKWKKKWKLSQIDFIKKSIGRINKNSANFLCKLPIDK